MRDALLFVLHYADIFFVGVPVHCLLHLLPDAQVAQPVERVADLFCPFIVADVRRLFHFALHPVGKSVDAALAFKYVLQRGDACHVAAASHVCDARRVAVLYEILEARRLGQPVAHPYLEQLSQKPDRQELAASAHKRPVHPAFRALELAVSVAPRHEQPGKRLVGDFQISVALLVLQLDVEHRPIALDKIRL